MFINHVIHLIFFLHDEKKHTPFCDKVNPPLPPLTKKKGFFFLRATFMHKMYSDSLLLLNLESTSLERLVISKPIPERK